MPEESPEKKLEECLKSYSRISLKERIAHIGRGLWHNKLKVMLAGALAASVWFSIPYFKDYTQYSNKVSGIKAAYKEIHNLDYYLRRIESECPEMKFEVDGTKIVDMFIQGLDKVAKDMPEFTAIADELMAKKQHSTPKETFEYLTKFMEKSDVEYPVHFSEPPLKKKPYNQPEKIVEDSAKLHERVDKIMKRHKGFKEVWSIGCGIFLGIFGFAYGAYLINGPYWRDEEYRSAKKWKKEYLKEFKGMLPEIKENLKHNENIEELTAYSSLLMQQSLPYYEGVRNAAEIIHLLSEKKDKTYKPIFDALLQQEFYQPVYYLKQLFDDFKAAENKQAFLTGIKEREELKNSLVKNIMKSGMEKYNAISLVENLLEASNGDNKLITLLESMAKYGKEVIQNTTDFLKKYSSISLEKRLAILKHLQKDGKLRVLKQLNEPFEKPEFLMKYAENLDELENVGVTGQIDFLLKIKDYLLFANSVSIQADPRIEDIIRYNFESKDDCLAEAVKFLERHKSIDAKSTLDDLISYYSFSKGEKSSFEAIEMEKRFIKDADGKHKAVDPKYERRFLREVKRKKNLARLKAIEKIMEDNMKRYLEQALDEKVSNPRGLTPELTLVIAALSKHDIDKKFAKLLKKAMAEYLKSPMLVRDYINNFDGNKNFEKNANPETIKGWKAGLEKRYEINGRAFEFYDAKDPIEAMQMGVVTNSCTNILHSLGYTSITNAVDINKKVVYVRDEKGKKVGRTLLALADEGIIAYRDYNSTGIRWSRERLDYLKELAANCNTNLSILEHGSYKHPDRELFKKEGGKKSKIKITIRKAVCSQWYNDYTQGNVEIKDKYTFKAKCYVFEPEKKVVSA